MRRNFGKKYSRADYAHECLSRIFAIKTIEVNIELFGERHNAYFGYFMCFCTFKFYINANEYPLNESLVTSYFEYRF